MFASVRAEDRIRLKTILHKIYGVLFLQLMVVVHNLNDFNIATIVIFICIFIMYFMGILSDILFYHSYYLKDNYAWIYVEMHNFTNNFLMILFTLGVIYELLYLDQRLLLYSFYVHLVYYVLYRRLNTYNYMRSVYNYENNKKYQAGMSMKKTSTFL
ncbi:MAG: hypothetical protein ACPHY8_04145 [Patescibacteria group bacterium]